jgi:putative phosphoribosyl transferase
MAHIFADRAEAGRELARRLGEYADRRFDAVVIGLPRGGVPVAAEVARVLNWPLDLLLARKLGAPDNPEFAIGAITHDRRVLNRSVIERMGITARALAAVEQRERRELLRREALYRHGRPPLDVAGKTVLVVDDGIATGMTMQCAALSLDALRPARLIVAAPVIAGETVEALTGMPEIDACVCVLRVPELVSVGLWYRDFDQVSDVEVMHAFYPPAARQAGQSAR